MLQTKYITIDEVEEYYPECKMREGLGEQGALAVVKRQEDFIESFINSNFNKNINNEYPVFSEYQKEKYKLALIEQVMYVFLNGEISVDSGYDQERGIITPDLLKKMIAPKTIMHLRECGIWNRVIGGNKNFDILGWFK